jgi:hypothetical protein
MVTRLRAGQSNNRVLICSRKKFSSLLQNVHTGSTAHITSCYTFGTESNTPGLWQ